MCIYIPCTCCMYFVFYGFSHVSLYVCLALLVHVCDANDVINRPT